MKFCHSFLPFAYALFPKTLSVPGLDSLVIDEADLILTYGHDDDIRQIFSGGFLPKVYQSYLMSATMTGDVETLKGLALQNPVSHSLLVILILSADYCPGNSETGRR